MQPLPIDAHAEEIVQALRTHGAVVIEASPGAGKTTRVPPLLLAAGLVAPGQSVLVLEPRRLAAGRVAAERGTALGDEVGYQVRFARKASERTRLLFMTEGLLTRRLMSDPTLAGVGAVVLDELHERHLHSDVALALLHRLRQGRRREDMKLVAMSATMDAAPVAELLEGPVVRCPEQRFEVAVEHLPREPREPLSTLVALAVRRLVREGLDGHVLVFLPGAAAIRQAEQACRAVAEQAGLCCLPLHGQLSAAEQDLAVQPGDQPKLILATNVAETSITIDGVAAVIDSGLAKIPTVGVWSGLPRLEEVPISRAAAAQRAGRAGRTRPGRCLRLYTERQLLRQRAFEEPEIARADLAEALLAIHAAGVTDPAALSWLQAPPAASLQAAERLLGRLGALTEAGELTAVGRAMTALPLHPRLARVLLEAEARGVAALACSAVAVLAEGRRLQRRHRLGGLSEPVGAESLEAQLELFEEARRCRFDPQRLAELSIDRHAASAIEQARQQLQRACRGVRRARTGRDAPPPGPDAADRTLGIALLTGFPERVARRTGQARGAGDIGLALAGGGTATVRDVAVLGPEGFTLALEATERPNQPARVTLALPIAADWLLDALPDAVETTAQLRWSAERERVELVEQLSYRQPPAEGLVLDEVCAAAPPSEAAAALLERAARRAGWTGLTGDGGAELQQWLGRARFAAAHTGDPELRALGAPDPEALVGQLCAGCTSLAELRARSVLQAVRSRLTAEQLATVERLAPARIRLPSGRELTVDYASSDRPFVGSYLQDFFGLAEGPTIAGGQHRLILHLWAPNGRAVQVTDDLDGFWQRHYPSLRRALSRRYPKHCWPEEPLTSPAQRLREPRGGKGSKRRR